jgi:ribonuclease HII
MNGRTWKNQSLATLEKIKSKLIAMGGSETEIKNQHELWRIKIADSVFISFKTGTLYHTPSNSNSTEVLNACQEVDAVTGTGYVLPTRDYLIGLDETGKGEIAGPIVLTGAILHKDLFEDFVKLVGPADTKKQHPFEYWQEIYNKLDGFRGKHFNFKEEKISPRLIDEYNVNRLLDLFYQKIISHLSKSLPHRSCRIVLDDYGAGESLRDFTTQIAGENGVIIVPKAEDQFIEAKVASLISKKIREGILENINQLPEYKIDNRAIGTGNISNQQTMRWLSKWRASGKPWPRFIKQSFKTIKDLKGQSDKVKKLNPILRNDLLPADFVRSFHGAESNPNLSAIKCSNCGQLQQTILFDLEQIICRNCSKSMDDIRLTLRYYCVSLVVDPRIVGEQILTRDLENGAFFENYRVIVPWTESSKQDFQFIEGGKELKKNESLGRLDLEYFKLDMHAGDIGAQIINKAIESNSMLIASSPQRTSDDNNLIDLAKEKKVLVCLV